jgi:hypothetical protein
MANKLLAVTKRLLERQKNVSIEVLSENNYHERFIQRLVDKV